MQKLLDERDNYRSSAASFLRKILWNLVIPIGILILGLLMEYRSGLFQPYGPNKQLPQYSHWALAIAITLAITFLFTKDCILVWLNKYGYVREQFAFLLLCMIISMTLVVVLSMLSGLMPWTFYIVLIQAYKNEPILIPETHATDYTLLLTFYVVILTALIQQHRGWDGLKSNKQYLREQRGEPSSLFAEGLAELSRIVRRAPPLEAHSDLDAKHLIPQLEPIKDLVSWKERAKELIRLSSPSYSFDYDSSWHDAEGCWVGQNVNTGELVFLYPCQDGVAENELKKFLGYIKRIAKHSKKKVGEIIVSTRREAAPLIKTWEGILVRYETEDSLLDSLVDFKDYYSEIRRRALAAQLPDSDLTLTDVYVPSGIIVQKGTKHNLTTEEYLNAWLDEAGQRQLALLGEYGQGKSTAALMWAFHLINQQPDSSQRIPLLIELRGTSPRNLTPLQMLGAWSAQYNMNPQSLMRLLVAGRLVIIFEGFDEMALVGDAEMRLKHFRTLWQFAYPKAKILITGRPNFFLDEEEMKAALGISKPIADRPYCEALRLSPFNPEQIKDALRAQKPSVREQINALVLKNPRFFELVSRPSLLHIVAVLWEREGLFEKVDQLTSAFVMDLFIRYSYRRQGLKEIDSPEFMALTTLEREYFMKGIATFMAAKRLPNQISSVQLNQVITDLINSIPESVSVASSAITGETTQPLRKRIKGNEYGVEHVKTDVRACGLLIDDPAAPGTFRFGHKSFMEYLFASVVEGRINEGSGDKAIIILNTTGARIEDIFTLPVTIDFLSELLVGSKDESGIDPTEKELNTARRLFRGIVLEYRPRLAKRLLAFVQTGDLLARKLSRRKRLFYRAFPALFIILSMLLIFLFNYLRLRYKLGVVGYYVSLILSTAVMFSSVCSLLPIVINILPPSNRKLRLWVDICTKMGMRNETFHKVLGTNLIPWVREQRVSYILDEL